MNNLTSLVHLLHHLNRRLLASHLPSRALWGLNSVGETVMVMVVRLRNITVNTHLLLDL